jgi:hypothetical protein
METPLFDIRILGIGHWESGVVNRKTKPRFPNLAIGSSSSIIIRAFDFRGAKMKILQDTALTYDDVLLVPQYSAVDSRRMLSTQTRLTNHSANTDRFRKYGRGH